MPKLHAAELQILQAVALKTLQNKRIDADQLSRQVGKPLALVNRVLTGLGSAGLVHLERLQPGQPFMVRVTKSGLKELSGQKDKPKPAAQSPVKPVAAGIKADPLAGKPKAGPVQKAKSSPVPAGSPSHYKPRSESGTNAPPIAKTEKAPAPAPPAEPPVAPQPKPPADSKARPYVAPALRVHHRSKGEPEAPAAHKPAAVQVIAPAAKPETSRVHLAPEATPIQQPEGPGTSTAQARSSQSLLTVAGGAADRQDSGSAEEQKPAAPINKGLYETLAPYMLGMDRDSFDGIMGQFSPDLLKALSRALAEKAKAEKKAAAAEAARKKKPLLSPVEIALEKKLQKSMNPKYQESPWYQRTKLFSFEWDQMRRRCLGVFSSYFTNFDPRWERSDWKDFNLARRQADSRGANYVDWIAAQFERIGLPEEGYVSPALFHGRAAVETYVKFIRQGKTGLEAAKPFEAQPRLQVKARPVRRKPAAAGPKVDLKNFDIKNPLHKQRAEDILQEIENLSQTVFGDDKDGLLRLMTQAIKNENLPMAALDLRISLKAKVLKILQEEDKAKGGAIALGGKPRLII